MEKIFLQLITLSFTGAVIFISCKKEKSCEGCRDTNKPPIAIAGPDQVITLPTDSISLDGSASNDPDGTISEWLWKKIEGPASFNINNTTAAKTIVKNLDTGVYSFELLVKDNGGLTAKDTMQVIVTRNAPTNRAPVANAGNDTTITLPANTILLNGSLSTDPDNNISSYMWTKISGPSPFNIANANAVQTQVTNLVQGRYQFELKVTDGGGLFSKDTIQVTVNAAPPILTCAPLNRPIVNLTAVPIVNLSVPRVGMAAVAAGNKIFFAGGGNSTLGYLSRVDIYDIATQILTTAEVSIPRTNMSAIAAGDKVFFAGGTENSGNASARVDIFNLVTQSWSTAELSQPRYYITTATVGNKVFFAGNLIGNGNGGFGFPSSISVTVDIFDISSNTWSIANLSETRTGFTATAAGSKIYFAGGGDGTASGPASAKIDIYDDATGIWSTSSLNVGKGFHSGIFKNGKIYWAGGATNIGDPWIDYNSPTCQIEIRDINSQATSFTNLSQPHDWLYWNGAFELNNKIAFINSQSYSSWYFDLYDVTTNSWSIGIVNPSISFWPGISISQNNTIYFAGGWSNNSGGGSYSQIWKIEF
ncbi:MAG TPA: PKD domain-containing protein [Chitinophagaceae bacterium]|jgi:hypothetical protein|nr:PKD domain-containing protein [Chitinophagaceae bacterium]